MTAPNLLPCHASPVAAPREAGAEGAGPPRRRPNLETITVRRLQELELALQRSSAAVHALQAELDRIQASDGWKLLTAYYKLRNRLFPRGSVRRRGAAVLFRSARWMLRLLADKQSATPLPDEVLYSSWIARHEPDARALAKQRQEPFTHEPLVSIVVPVYKPAPAHLEAMLESVLAQTYARWQLCLADGNSPGEVRSLLQHYAGKDDRIRLALLEDNRGIAGNSAAALALATGPYVALLDHDDVLAPFALYEVVRALNEHPEADFLYSDEDHLNEDGERYNPHFKPDWSPDTLHGHNYVCHLLVLRHELLEEAGGFRAGFEGAQDYDLVLRSSERARQIVHIPKVLYHWRIHTRSFSHAETQMDAYEAGRRALEEHLQRLSIAAYVGHGSMPGTYQVVRPLPRRPLVSILIPSHDQHQLLARCLDSIARSSYRNYEVLIAENHSKEPETFAYYKSLADRPEVRLLSWPKPFNYAAINNWAAAQARGEVLLLLNNDTEARHADWLERLLEHALRPEVGAVGAKLYYPDGSIQHGGVIMGIGGFAGHAHQLYPGAAGGYFHRLVITQNLSAVTGACLMLRREVFEEVHGMDERFVVAYNDVDLCLRIRQKGYRILWTPFAELTHHEAQTRGFDNIPAKRARLEAEMSTFKGAWDEVLRAGDPFYNPNLTLKTEDFSLRQ